MSEREIRAATVRDVSALRPLELVVFGPDAWSSGLLADELTPCDSTDASSRCGLVVSDGDRIVGYAFLRRSGDAADLVRVAVEPTNRRQGVGTALVLTLLGTARGLGCTRVLLEVAADNEPALRCYARLGFTELDRRSGYYADGVDALVLHATV